MQYSDAALHCAKIHVDSHLAVIQSDEENDFVAMVAGSKRAWIGASRKFQNSSK